uniref:Uncharacterized protein n=1 Tax=Timema bartmani TaxID=61472 RepID=A0A7R9F7Q1_9NEOP|nr:unnamed protein product [Timema bartmani]
MKAENVTIAGSRPRFPECNALHWTVVDVANEIPLTFFHRCLSVALMMVGVVFFQNAQDVVSVSRKSPKPPSVQQIGTPTSISPSAAIKSNARVALDHAAIEAAQSEWVVEARHMLDQSVKGSSHRNRCTLPNFMKVTEFACIVVMRKPPLCGNYAPQPTHHADPKAV